MSRRSSPTTGASADRSTTVAAKYQPTARAAAFLLAIAVCAVYASSLDVPLFFDDTPTIIDNQSITSVWPLIGTAERPGPLQPEVDLPTAARPLVNLSFALNYAFGGVSPFGYHVVNVLFHFLNSLLLWSIIRRTLLLPYFAGRFNTSASWLALITALLWALHPLQTETVTYVTQRTELMVIFFYLATLFCAIRYWSAPEILPRSSGEGAGEGGLPPTADEHTPAFGNRADDRNAWLLLAILASLAGMASKEIMVSAPVIVLLFDRLFISGSLWQALRRSWPLYLGLAATWTLLILLNSGRPRGSSAGFHIGIPLQSWWYTQCEILVRYYLKLVVWPAPLLVHYELPYRDTLAAAWMYVIPVAIIAILAIVLLLRNTLAGFLLAFFAAILAPTFIVPIGTEMAAERRMYLPLAVILVSLVVGGYALLRNRREHRRTSRQSAATPRSSAAATLALAALLTAYGVVSAHRVNEYHDEMTLWRQVIHYQPDNSLAHHNLAITLKKAGRKAESFAELQAAVAARLDFADARSDLGFALLEQERLPEALKMLESALDIEPDHVPALNNYGIALIEAQRYAEAINVLERAFKLDPKNVEVRNNLARVLTITGNPDRALTILQPAAELAPNNPDVYFNLANALGAKGDANAAIQLLEHSLELKPDFSGAHNSLAIALNQIGDIAGARRHFEKFLELRPKNPGALCNLANIIAAQGDYPYAATLYRKALEVQPNSAEAHYSLGTALVQTGELPEAIEHFQKSLELKPTLFLAYANLASALASANRTPEAIDVAQQGLAIAKASKDAVATTQLENWLKQHQPPKQPQ
ncbi:MAG: tetratricopeptide repeat protein [Pirellulales bacterium]